VKLWHRKPFEFFDNLRLVCYRIIILKTTVANNFRSADISKTGGGQVNKLELIDALKNDCQISKREAATIVDLFFDRISEALAAGNRVEIRGTMFFLCKRI
jgi:hypothetical protein